MTQKPITDAEAQAIIQQALDTHINQVAGWFYHGQIAPYLPEMVQFMLAEIHRQGIHLVKDVKP